jgi:hypothetical protein
MEGKQWEIAVAVVVLAYQEFHQIKVAVVVVTVEFMECQG